MSGKALHPDNDYLQVSVNLAAFMVWQQILSLHNTELLLMYHIAAFMKESSFQFIFFFKSGNATDRLFTGVRLYALHILYISLYVI